MLLPDPGQAFKILGAMITDNQCQMALSFPSDLSDPMILVHLKFYTAQRKYKDKNKKLHAMTKQGKVSRCATFDSNMQWAKY